MLWSSISPRQPRAARCRLGVATRRRSPLALDGTPNPDVVSELAPSGRLGRQAATIGADLDVPLTLAPSPETLDAWLFLTTARAILSSPRA